jgi:hypothetical protein
MQAVMTASQPRRGIVWAVVYAALLLLSAYILYCAIDSAPVIWQTEAQLGHALTCNEAYDRREINNTLNFEHRTPSDVLYLFHFVSPFWLVLFGAVTLAFVARTGFSRRIRWVALGAALALTAAILLYMPAIRLIACATE